MSRLDFIALGEQEIPGVPLRCVPLAEPRAGALYRRRIEAMRSSAAEYVCFVDGGDDVCLPGFVDAMEALASRGCALGYAEELINGNTVVKPPFTLQNFLREFTTVHHGVVCRRTDLMAINWPEGCYSWEVLAYGALAQISHAYDPVPRYDWRPGPGGARLWPDYARGVVNSLRWLQGLPGVHFRKDFQ